MYVFIHSAEWVNNWKSLTSYGKKSKNYAFDEDRDLTSQHTIFWYKRLCTNSKVSEEI